MRFYNISTSLTRLVNPLRRFIVRRILWDLEAYLGRFTWRLNPDKADRTPDPTLRWHKFDVTVHATEEESWAIMEKLQDISCGHDDPSVHAYAQCPRDALVGGRTLTADPEECTHPTIVKECDLCGDYIGRETKG